MIDRQTLSKLAADAYEDVLNGKLSHLNPFDAIADAVLAAPATVSSAVPRAWEIVTKPGTVPDYTCFPTVAEQARRDGKLVTPLYAVQVSNAAPVAFIVHDDPELGDYLTKSRQAADASGKRVTPLYAEPLQNPQRLDRAAIIEECAKVADKWADEYGDPADTMHAAHGVARAIRALIEDTK